MTDASTSETMSPGLLKVVERAKTEPEGRFHSLAHLIDVPALMRAYRRMRKDAAVGVDGITKEQYGQDQEGNLCDLHERLVSKRYRHQPIRRVHIPKDKGKTRPIGISAFEDKLVQDTVREVLEAIYEQDFLACSYGFRPERSAHDAIRALDRIMHRGKVCWILEADIVSFFDSLDRTKLMEMLQIRVADGSRRGSEGGLVQVAPPSEPAGASHLEEVRRASETLSSSASPHQGPNLGDVAASHLSGRAGWWKSPCPVPARAPGEQSPGLLYNAF